MIYLFIVFILTAGGELHPVEAHQDVQVCEATARHYNRVSYFSQQGKFFCMASTDDNGGRDD